MKLVFVLIVALLAAPAAAKDLEEGWAETSADMNLVRFFINKQYPCYDNARNFLGCIQMINDLGSRATPKLGILTPEIKELDADIEYSVIADLGGALQFARITRRGHYTKSFEERELLDKRWREILAAAAERVLADSGGQQPDFERLATGLLKDLPPTISRQRAVGLALNALMEVNDWHSHINPIAYLIDQADSSTVKADAPQNLTTKILKDMGREILLLKLESFLDFNACADIQAAIKKNPRVAGIILDLRDNPGGMVDQVTCVGGLFVGKQTIFMERKVVDGQVAGRAIPQKSLKSQMTKKPLIILIDAGSASASELLAGTMQDYKRAWIVGIRSYGKGTLQTGNPHPLDSSIYWYRTTHAYLLPAGRSIQARGVEPDFTVAAAPGLLATEHFEREEDFLPYVLPPDPQPQAEARPAEVAHIEQDCLAIQHFSEDFFAKGPGADYPLLKAQEIMTCFQTPAKENTAERK